MEILVSIWSGIIGFAIFMYVLLDGFDLGIGILLPLIRKENDRALMISTIIPVWDGNQTWLVLGGACLYGAFPTAFATLMPLLYLPLIIMLIALILRGVALEFRLKSTQSVWLWNYVFCLGSILAGFTQGLILGTFVQGFGQQPYPLASGSQPWLTTFSCMTGLGTICGYVLLGCGWLIIKTKGHIQQTAQSMAWVSLSLVALFMLIFSIWTPLLSTFHWQRWLSYANIPYLATLPLCTMMLFALCAYALYHRYEYLPFIMTIGIFLCGAIGVTISTYPYIVPQSMTFSEAAAPASALAFMLYGITIMLPVLLSYTAYAHYIFRGKVTQALHY